MNELYVEDTGFAAVLEAENNKPDVNFVVTWVVDLYATTPEEAAIKARQIQLAENNNINMFTVCPLDSDEVYEFTIND